MTAKQDIKNRQDEREQTSCRLFVAVVLASALQLQTVTTMKACFQKHHKGKDPCTRAAFLVWSAKLRTTWIQHLCSIGCPKRSRMCFLVNGTFICQTISSVTQMRCISTSYQEVSTPKRTKQRLEVDEDKSGLQPNLQTLQFICSHIVHLFRNITRLENLKSSFLLYLWHMQVSKSLLSSHRLCQKCAVRDMVARWNTVPFNALRMCRHTKPYLISWYIFCHKWKHHAVWCINIQCLYPSRPLGVKPVEPLTSSKLIGPYSASAFYVLTRFSVHICCVWTNWKCCSGQIAWTAVLRAQTDTLWQHRKIICDHDKCLSLVMLLCCQQLGSDIATARLAYHANRNLDDFFDGAKNLINTRMPW